MRYPLIPFSILSMVLVALLGAGCSSHRDSNKDLDALLAAYQANNERLTQTRQSYGERGIERLAVRVDPATGAMLVDLVAVDAGLGVVVQRIMAASGLDYAAGPHHLGTRTTARFEGRPLAEALDLLLAPAGLGARISDGVAVLEESSTGLTKELSPGDGDEDAAGDDETQLERRLRVADIDNVMEVLDALYPTDEDTGMRPVRFAARPETGSIFLAGSRSDVMEASRLLDRLDAHLDHVLLEALVVEFNNGSFRDVGSRLEAGSSGKLRGIAFDVANLVGDTLSFTRVADVAASTSFAAVLDLLIQEEQARVISRPWLATLSGSPAALEIAEDRYVLTEVPGAFEVTLEEISSGVNLDITPVVRVDGTIRLGIEITESQFIPSLENVAQRRSRNSVKTTAQVGAGESVIIGGLMLKRRGLSKAGIPFLREIFPLSLVFGHEDYSHSDTQVLIYITPHLWAPGLELPLASSDDFDVYSPPAAN